MEPNTEIPKNSVLEDSTRVTTRNSRSLRERLGRYQTASSNPRFSGIAHQRTLSRQARQAAENQTSAQSQVAAQTSVAPHNNGASGVAHVATNSLRKAKVATIGFGLLAWYAWFYLLQLGFGIIYMLAIYTENETLWGWVIPGQTLAYVAWAVASVTSLSFMLIGAFTYFATATNIYSWPSVAMFIVGCTGSIVPYFNIVPWLLLWIGTLLQSKNSHSDT